MSFREPFRVPLSGSSPEFLISARYGQICTVIPSQRMEPGQASVKRLTEQLTWRNTVHFLLDGTGEEAAQAPFLSTTGLIDCTRLVPKMK